MKTILFVFTILAAMAHAEPVAPQAFNITVDQIHVLDTQFIEGQPVINLVVRNLQSIGINQFNLRPAFPISERDLVIWQECAANLRRMTASSKPLQARIVGRGTPDIFGFTSVIYHYAVIETCTLEEVLVGAPRR